MQTIQLPEQAERATAIAPLRGWRGIFHLCRRFSGNRSGSTAIEFVALAIPFSLLVFAILEGCVSFAAQQVLANATDDVARQLRTGQIKAADIDKPKLRKLVCDRLSLVVTENCPGLEVDLKSFNSFADAAAVRIKFTTDKDLDTSGFAASPGKSMSRNMLRVFYRWPVMTDFMRKSMSNMKDSKTLLFATMTWQNEPFDD